MFSPRRCAVAVFAVLAACSPTRGPDGGALDSGIARDGGEGAGAGRAGCVPLVDRPTSMADGGLGVFQCPRDAGCPERCHEVSGQRVDVEACCTFRDFEVIECSGYDGALSPSVSCFVRIADGVPFLASGEHLYEPEFSGWRVCTERERDAVLALPECDEPVVDAGGRG
jgi:hypothetical protein